MATVSRLADTGVEHVIFSVSAAHEPGAVDVLADVVRQVAPPG